MLTSELIYNLRTNLSAKGSTLLGKTDQHIYYMLNQARSILIGRKLQNKSNTELYKQFIDLTPSKSSSNIMSSSTCGNLYFISPPKTIQLNNNEGITYVGTTAGQMSYAQIDYGTLRTFMYKKYTGKDPKWLLDEGNVILINLYGNALTKVRVRGYFEDPLQVIKTKQSISKFEPYDWEYPISNKDADALYKIAMSSDMGWGDAAMQLIARQEYEQRKEQQKAENAQKR